MVKNVFIFRHGQTDKNLAGLWQGYSIDVPLNKTGLEQAEQLAEKVKTLNLDKLFSSPLIRARQTAQKISEANGNMLVTVYNDLHEADFGVAEGQTFAKIQETFGELATNYLNPDLTNWDNHFPKGESKHEVFDRVYACLNRIVNENEGKNLGIVCHAGVMNALECGLSLKGLTLENCAVWHLKYDTDTMKFYQ